jgi:hypothetical protein
MCGGGYAPPDLVPNYLKAVPLSLGRSPGFLRALARKGEPFRTSGGRATTAFSPTP